MTLNPLFDVLRALFSSLTLVLNTLLITLCLLPLALLKLVLPFKPVRRALDRALNALASAWVAVNSGWMAAISAHTRWEVQGLQGLDARGWYVVISNHQSWVDILILQRALRGHVPFLKFFLKRELIWVPVIGLAWWALDFPFMGRGATRSALKRDLKTTRRACERFRHTPTSVMNFVEGTRATPAKRAQSRSPYRHLLRPKVGGLGMALATLGDQFHALLDVTIVYTQGTPRLWDFFSGRMGPVQVRVQQREIPAHLLGTAAALERGQHQRLGEWLEPMWREKDQWIEDSLRLGHAGAAPGAPAN